MALPGTAGLWAITLVPLGDAVRCQEVLGHTERCWDVP